MTYPFKSSPLLALALVACPLASHATLSLDEALNLAIQNNFGYQSAALNPIIAEAGVTAQAAAFDTELFATGRLSGSEAATIPASVEGSTTDRRDLSAGVRKRLVYGTTLTAQTNLDRLDSRSAGTTDTSSLSENADFSVSVRQPLLGGRGRAANASGLEQARAGLTAAQARFRNDAQDLLAETELAYWSVARLQEQLELDRSSLEVAETLLKEAQERERVGVATRIDVLQAEASKARRMEEIIATTRALGNAYDNLLTIMGTLPEASQIEPEETVEPLAAPSAGMGSFSTLLQQALQNDPLLTAQEQVIQQREWEVKAASNATRPTLDLVLTAGLSGADDAKAQDAIRNAADADGHNWAAGLEFSMPWSLRGEKARLRGAELRLQQEQLRLDELRQGIFRIVRSTWRSLEAVQQSIEAASLSVSFEEAAFEREMSKYEEGLSAFRDVLQAQSSLDQARARLLAARFERLATEIEMARATGTIFARHGITAGNP